MILLVAQFIYKLSGIKFLAKQNNTKTAIIILTFLVNTASYSQTANVKFKHLDIDNGLSNNMITGIVQDKSGFLWISTWDGLNRYDGYNFKIYKHINGDSTSLRVNKISSLLVDNQDRLWVGTFGGGLSLFNREQESFTNFIHNPENSNSIITDKIISLFQDSKNRIWIGTGNIGVSLIENIDSPNSLSNFGEIKFNNFQTDKLNPYSIKGDGVYSFTEGKDGTIWLGTNKGWLNKLLPEKFEFISYHPNLEKEIELSDLSFEGLLEDKFHPGIIWISEYYNRLFWFDSKSEKFVYEYPFDNFNENITVTKIQTVFFEGTEYWLGGFEEKIYNYKPGNYNNIIPTYKQFSIKPDEINIEQETTIERIYSDRSGIIWIGTSSNGIYTFKNNDRFLSYSIPINGKLRYDVHVLSVMVDNQNNLWIGTMDGLYKFNKYSTHYKHYKHNPSKNSLSSDIVYSIHQNSEDEIWIGTSSGLDRFNPQKDNFTNYKHNPKNPNSISNGEIIKLFTDSKGSLWIGTWNGGLNKLITNIKNEQVFQHYKFNKDDPSSISNNRIMSISEDNNGHLWFGTADGGLNKLVSDYGFNTDSSIVRPVFESFLNDPNKVNSISNNDVRSIHIDKNGTIWLGTFGGGLNKLILGQSNKDSVIFHHYNQDDGLANDVVRNILEDDEGNLWLGTANGLSRFDPITENFWNYHVSDGLQTDKFEDVAFQNKGIFYFGGIGGLVSFKPTDFQVNKYIPDVVISSCKYYNKSEEKLIEEKGISEKKRIILSHQDNILSFEFSSLNFYNAPKNRYAYKLEGYNNNWIQLGNKREVTFTNLSPGEYNLMVKGSNNDGVWNTERTTLAIIIMPPWWQTWWAYTIYGLSFLLILYFIRRYELVRISLKNQLKIEKVESNSLRKLDKIKTRFFTNISHEFRTPLTLILGQIENVQSANLDIIIKKKLHVAHKNAQRILRLINQLLDLSKIDAGEYEIKAKPYNIVPFLKNIFYSFESLAEGKNIELKLKCSTDNICVDFEPEKMEKVFYNIISNAFKFTKNGGKIRIEVLSSSMPKEKFHINNFGRFVSISVTDNGVGIERSRIPLIFDRFYQVDSSQTRNYSGTGIGLAIAKELVELHNGTISVYSEEGAGSKFVINLPISKKTEQEVRPQINSQNTGLIEYNEEIIDKNDLIESADFNDSDTRIKSFTSKIIQIVEDNYDVRNYIKEQLLDEYTIIEAVNGLEGIKLAEKSIPDIIITDVMMPKLDGYRFCEKIRKSEKTSHIPIIMLTAKASLDEKIEGLETGIDAFITKPFNSRELKVRVSKLLYQRDQLRKKHGHIAQLKPSEINVQSIDKIFLDKVIKSIENHLEDEIFGIDVLASEVNMSVSQLNRKLGALVNQSAGKLIRSIRLQRAADLLKQNSGSIAEICYQVGFSDQANFTRAFKKQFGDSPSAYKKKN